MKNINSKLCRKLITFLLAMSITVSNSSMVYAQECNAIGGLNASEYSSKLADVSAQYPVIKDKVEGSNIETFYIDRPDASSMTTVNASQFGLSVNNEDNYGAFSDALSYCKKNPNTRLVIDKGVYYFKPNPSLELDGFKNILIEGNGAEFIFESQKQFKIDDCDTVEIRNLIVDWNWEVNRVASLVQVQNKNKEDKTFEIKFLELDEVDVNIPIVSFQQYDKKELIPGSYGGWKTFNPIEVPSSIVNVEKLEPNVLKIYYSDDFTTDFHNEDVYILRHYTYGGAVFTVGDGSSNITFDNVSIYGSAGMGFVFGERTSHFQIINSYIGLRPGGEDKQRMSTSADGIHILNTDGYFKISNCDFSFTGDDIINIHDDMLKITDIDSKSRNTFTGYVTGGFVHEGDTVRIYNKNIEDVGFESEVVSFVRHGEGGTVVLKDPLPSGISEGFFVYRSSDRTHNYVISNNYIHETKGRGALLNAPDALFENNTFYRTASSCVQVRVDLSENNEKIWYEGSGAKNVVVNNNTFNECSFGGSDSLITIDCKIGTKTDVLSDIHITNNEFYSCYGAKKLITADNVSNLYIENNYISDCGDISVSSNCGSVIESGNSIVNQSATCPHTDTMKIGNRQPGCYEYGNTGKTYCNQCHTIIDSSYAGIPPLNHKNMLEPINVEPTCTTDGMTGQVCTLCRAMVDVEVIPALGHDYVVVIDKAATATTAGSKHEECTRCGDKKAAVAIPSCTPTPKPTATATPKPTSAPTLTPTAVPTSKPTATPTSVPSATPTSTAVPTNKPTATPVPTVTAAPTAVPTSKPTPVPTLKPTATPVPTATATPKPTAKPTLVPSANPSPTPSVEPTKAPTVDEFVERLYTTCLGREAEQEGKDYWVAELKGGKPGSEVAEGFFFSKELTDKKLNNKEFITQLYKTFMDRDPETEGMNYWLNEMKSGKDKKFVFDGFVNSVEWADICLTYGIRSGGLAKPSFEKDASDDVIAFAERLYTTCLGRDSEEEGLKFWSQELANLRITGTEAAEGFFFSKEFEGFKLNNKDYVTRLYRTFMGREPEAEGFNFWISELKSGKSRKYVFDGFATAQEFADICADAGILR